MKTLFSLALLIIIALLIWYVAAPENLKETVWSFAPAILQLQKSAEEPVPLPDPLPFTVPDGFAVSLFTDEVPGARVLARDPKGVFVVSLTQSGKVVALPNHDADYRADRVVTILEGLKKPHGLVFNCPETGNESADQDACTLYVAEEHRVQSYRYDADLMTATPLLTILELPAGNGHSTRTLLLHPDGQHLLTSVGSSCNACIENDERCATVLITNLATKETRIYAKGLRNTVFMQTHPVTGEIWGTDNGRDLLGDDIPPDEVNILQEGENYGWPICYGKNIHDTVFDHNTYIRAPCQEPFETPSHIDIQAHSAPLGLAFVPEEGWPEEYWFNLLVAYHGSWNRSIPTGYKIVRFDLDAHGRPTGEVSDFMTGFMQEDGTIIGRPVDIYVEPGGTMWVTDDHAGAVYRVLRTSLD